jgi:hypothetical protein
MVIPSPLETTDLLVARNRLRVQPWTPFIIPQICLIWFSEPFVGLHQSCDCRGVWPLYHKCVQEGLIMFLVYHRCLTTHHVIESVSKKLSFHLNYPLLEEVTVAPANHNVRSKHTVATEENRSIVDDIIKVMSSGGVR